MRLSQPSNMHWLIRNCACHNSTRPISVMPEKYVCFTGSPHCGHFVECSSRGCKWTHRNFSLSRDAINALTQFSDNDNRRCPIRSRMWIKIQEKSWGSTMYWANRKSCHQSTIFDWDSAYIPIFFKWLKKLEKLENVYFQHLCWK